MNSIKKRKVIIESDDEDSVQLKNDHSSDDEVKKTRLNSPVTKKNRKPKRKKQNESDDDESISINSIKKKAKENAKKYTVDDESIVLKSSTKRSNSKTPPKPLQKNTLLNYFKAKPAAVKKDEDVSDDKNDFTKVKDKESLKEMVVSDEFITTTLSKDKKPNLVKVESPEPKKTVSTKSPKKAIKRTTDKLVKEVLPRIVENKRVSGLLVDKYKPTSTKQIVGLQGDRSSMNKLIKWLSNWHMNFNKKPGFGKWASDDGAGFKAALLSGPPGIGKTTTAQLVCKELGFDLLELNASDGRNKKSLQEDVRDLLANTKLTSFFKVNSENSESKHDKSMLTAKHCVVMDEVDGMAGNEDRGGIQELIQLIKSTKVPLICICNDRGDTKMRSLVNYCFDLRFQKPRIDQIKGYLRSIAFKEKIDISPNVLDDLIASSNNDIRQCIHNLSMFRINSQVPSMIKSGEYQKPIKDVKLGPFDAIRKVFCTGAEYAKMSFSDKSDLFFSDYSIMPLFVFENYHTVNLSSKQPSMAKQLKRMLKTIDSISFGDLIEKEIRTNQNWSLLPLQAAYSTVMPGSYMRSSNGLGFPQFPQFMGKLSTTNKNLRLTDELVSHMALSITGTRTSFTLDYLQPFKDSLIQPLLNSEKDGINDVLSLLENYSLTKENMDSLLELSLWSGDNDPMKMVDTKTKTALTKAYNKKDFTLPYTTDKDTRTVTKQGKGKAKKNIKPLKSGKNRNSLVVMSDKSDEASDNETENELNQEEMLNFY